ncbi:MAG: hypothetical protein NC343_05165 [Muribaculum sp.]|nr:hypothetical protein [Muribaculaceae bacterium]MCM1081122.1 hypothetical protein [Muribaculum sp.]
MKKQLFVLMAVAAASTSLLNAQITTIEAQNGWDIYEAGVYRYGPSFITNDDGSIDAWFAAPGSEYEDCVMCDYETSPTPYFVTNTGFIGQYIEMKRPFIGFTVYSPTWGNNGTQTLRLSIYKWDTNINKTRRSTPLAQRTFSNYNDNDILSVSTENDVELPAGNYVFLVDRASQNAGVYHYPGLNPEFDGCVYIGNTQKAGALRGHVLYDSKKITQYWDQASYQHSEDGGKTWTAEKMVLKPTRHTRDEYSVCDPDVAYWGGYYYAGYTSTENAAGIENHLYVARSKSPEGPWEKWNGDGWGGDKVEPIVEYTPKGGWGIGEPSIIIKDNTVYLYYTYDNGGPTTRLSTAPADSENWPALLELKGTAITKSSSSDHCDVKYVDAARRFLAVNTTKRMSKEAYIQMWQSEDGLNFEPIGDGKMQGILYPSGLHNCGLNGDAQGHIDVNKPQHIAFAYGLDSNGNSRWACWSTFLQPITIKCDAQSGIESVTINNNAPVQMYNMQGIEVDADTQAPGLYILRQGDKTEKIAR